jgi:hypothetical protein
MYTRWKEPTSKRKNKWDIFTYKILETVIQIRDDERKDRVINERDITKYDHSRLTGFI